MATSRKNKHGLARDIPADMKRAVRQRDGYGCVICGLGIYQYEHVEPSFAEARLHEAKNITLLCSQCHDKVTRGFLSKATVRSAMENPLARQKGFAHETLDFRSWPRIYLGSIATVNALNVLSICGKPVIWIDPPEITGAPFRLSASFLDAFDQPRLLIVENEFRVFSGNWDVTAEGGSIVVRDSLTKIALSFQVTPPSELHFDAFDVRFKGYRVFIDRNTGGLNFEHPGGRTVNIVGGATFDYTDSISPLRGISVDAGGPLIG